MIYLTVIHVILTEVCISQEKNLPVSAVISIWAGGATAAAHKSSVIHNLS